MAYDEELAERIRELIAGGDHTIAIGAVRELGLGEGEPLLWYGGRYHPWSASAGGLSSA